ncbi:MAG TPA: class D sortase, partial [Erythrobacter sp.]|nr:class D sortase [Erythrobacter sp.]
MVEVLLWILGTTAIAAYVGALAWSEGARQRDIVNFAATQAAIALAHPAPPLPSLLPTAVAAQSVIPSPAAGTILAVLRIHGIALEVPVSYGTGEPVLLRGAGLIEGTALPGSAGNVAIAAHRDTFFRGLEDLALDDVIELDSPAGTQTYRVTATLIVDPADVYVLADQGEPVQTLVTCFP